MEFINENRIGKNHVNTIILDILNNNSYSVIIFILNVILNFIIN